MVRVGSFDGYIHPQYLELVSTKLFDTGYHLSDILQISSGCKSEDFEAFRTGEPTRM